MMYAILLNSDDAPFFNFLMTFIASDSVNSYILIDVRRYKYLHLCSLAYLTHYIMNIMIHSVYELGDSAIFLLTFTN